MDFDVEKCENLIKLRLLEDCSEHSEEEGTEFYLNASGQAAPQYPFPDQWLHRLMPNKFFVGLTAASHAAS